MTSPRKYIPNQQDDEFDEVYRRLAIATADIERLEQRLRNTGGMPLPRLDIIQYPLPFEGQRAIDVADEQHAWYSNGEWRKAGGSAIYAIEVFEIDIPVIVGDGAFEWEIPEDLDGAVLLKVEGYVNTVSSSGSVQVQLVNEREAGGTPDMLTTKITIEAGELNSKDATAQPVVDLANDNVVWGDHIRVDVDASGTGTLGLGIISYWVPSAAKTIAIEGSQGPPGGVTNFTGQYQSGPAWVTATGYTIGQVVLNGGTFYVATANHTSGALTEPGVGANWMTVWQVVTYTTGQAVSNNGTSYVAIQDHTATAASEPGVGANWEDFWMVLAEGHTTSEISVSFNGNAYPLDTGVKLYVPVYFACTIVEATLLADVAGSIVIDIWKDTYGNFPPVNADSITSSSPPSLTGAQKSTDTALAGWTTSIVAGDVLGFNIDSCSGIHACSLSLKVQRI